VEAKLLFASRTAFPQIARRVAKGEPENVPGRSGRGGGSLTKGRQRRETDLKGKTSGDGSVDGSLQAFMLGEDYLRLGKACEVAVSKKRRGNEKTKGEGNLGRVRQRHRDRAGFRGWVGPVRVATQKRQERSSEVFNDEEKTASEGKAEDSEHVVMFHKPGYRWKIGRGERQTRWVNRKKTEGSRKRTRQNPASERTGLVIARCVKFTPKGKGKKDSGFKAQCPN